MRKAEIKRKTNETNIELSLNIDGAGKRTVVSPVGFLNHMLDLFSFHSQIDLHLEASGDTEIDNHHTVEDIGIALGKALKEAVGDKAGINRYGFFVLPMDEARVTVSLDFSGRPYFVYEGIELTGKTGDFDLELVPEFFQALSTNCGLTLHITVEAGVNKHHIVEAIFKSFARATKIALSSSGSDAVPSTKGKL